MKYLTILFIVLYFFTSCNRNEPEINITSSKDTILIGETYNATLIAPSMDTILPMFYIIIERDSFPMPYYEDKNYAVFQAEETTEGLKKYNGAVHYIDKRGKEKWENFKIEFFVKK